MITLTIYNKIPQPFSKYITPVVNTNQNHRRHVAYLQISFFCGHSICTKFLTKPLKGGLKDIQLIT